MGLAVISGLVDDVEVIAGENGGTDPDELADHAAGLTALPDRPTSRRPWSATAPATAGPSRAVRTALRTRPRAEHRAPCS